MTTPDRYTIIFNTQGSNVILGSTNATATLNVNWSAILDPKYKRFHCQFVFKSLTTSDFRTDNAFVNMNFGTKKIFDGLSATDNIGIVYPVSLSTSQSFYSSTNNDNNDFYINYPTSNNVTISLNSFAESSGFFFLNSN